MHKSSAMVGGIQAFVFAVVICNSAIGGTTKISGLNGVDGSRILAIDGSASFIQAIDGSALQAASNGARSIDGSGVQAIDGSASFIQAIDGSALQAASNDARSIDGSGVQAIDGSAIFTQAIDGSGLQAIDGSAIWSIGDGDFNASRIQPVPIPPTLWLLGSALTGLVVRRRRKCR